ncbi:glycosyltransferase family 4 protein [Lignipirellula cremea]|uniref:Spore coat protein SA n=1 Tax=Lignipirellula cremea TaxID=2528010 RepID=A0A518DNA3_9BACT|nr:glycosyltransferase family 4 protein [Lignipirellula cremea]QDU93317.1 Spore coat protein SA [Lignipirellula cremea]
MRVLMLFEYPSLNGGEYSFLAHAAVLQQRDCRFLAAGPPQGELAAALAQRQIPLHPCSWRHADQRRFSRTEMIEHLVDLVQQTEPDLVHANSLSMARWLGAAAPRLTIPCVGHVRDIVKLSKAAAADLQPLSRLLCVSAATRAMRLEQGADPERTQVLYNGVDTVRFAPCDPADEQHHESTHEQAAANGRDQAGRALRQELGVPADVCLAGGVGQIGMRKGWDTLLQAAALLAPDALPVQIVLVGERHSQKDEAIAYEQALHAAGARLARPALFLGRRDDMPSLLRAFDLLVHPARQEPLGRVLLEAAASGAAVVTTEVGGTPEIFPPGTALLVPQDDPPALAAAMASLLNDPPQRLHQAAAARQRILEQFTDTRAATNLEVHYRSLVAPCD